MVQKRIQIHFEFSEALVKEPLLYQLNRSFKEVETNIRAARVTDDGGFLALELSGKEKHIAEVLEYLKNKGIEVHEGLGKES